MLNLMEVSGSASQKRFLRYWVAATIANAITVFVLAGAVTGAVLLTSRWLG